MKGASKPQHQAKKKAQKSLKERRAERRERKQKGPKPLLQAPAA